MFAAMIFVTLHFLVMLKSKQLNTYLFSKVLKILQWLLAERCVSDHHQRPEHRYRNTELLKIYLFMFCLCLQSVCSSSIIISFFHLLTFLNQAL